MELTRQWFPFFSCVYFPVCMVCIIVILCVNHFNTTVILLKTFIPIPVLSLQQHKMATYSFSINTTSPVNIAEEEEDIRSLAKQFLMYKVGKHNIAISYFSKFDEK